MAATRGQFSRLPGGCSSAGRVASSLVVSSGPRSHLGVWVVTNCYLESNGTGSAGIRATRTSMVPLPRAFAPPPLISAHAHFPRSAHASRVDADDLVALREHTRYAGEIAPHPCVPSLLPIRRRATTDAHALRNTPPDSTSREAGHWGRRQMVDRWPGRSGQSRWCGRHRRACRTWCTRARPVRRR
jgi:hypothetical protein